MHMMVKLRKEGRKFNFDFQQLCCETKKSYKVHNLEFHHAFRREKKKIDRLSMFDDRCSIAVPQ